MGKKRVRKRRWGKRRVGKRRVGKRRVRKGCNIKNAAKFDHTLCSKIIFYTPFIYIIAEFAAICLTLNMLSN